MHPKLKYSAYEIANEWLLKCVSLQMAVTCMIVFKLAKYFYLGPLVLSKSWHQSKISSYQILKIVWSEEIFHWVMLLPVAVLADIILRKLFAEFFNAKA